MTTQPKAHAATRTKRPAGAPAEAAEPPSRPFLRFYHSERLRTKTLAVLEAIEQAEDASAHSKALADVAVELMGSAMDYYFMRPLKLAKVGFVVEQSASLGMAGTQQVMGAVIRNIIGRMDTAQLVSVCGSIRQFMR